jgi:hypothetical protein
MSDLFKINMTPRPHAARHGIRPKTTHRRYGTGVSRGAWYGSLVILLCVFWVAFLVMMGWMWGVGIS